MGAITIQVNPEIAKAYQEINSTRREKLELLFSILLKQELDNRPLSEIMDSIGYKAQSRGLTPEILASILADEK
jgi:hypothetical protein